MVSVMSPLDQMALLTRPPPRPALPAGSMAGVERELQSFFASQPQHRGAPAEAPASNGKQAAKRQSKAAAAVRKAAAAALQSPEKKSPGKPAAKPPVGKKQSASPSRAAPAQRAAPQAGMHYHADAPNYALIPPPVELLRLRGVHT